MAKKQTKSSLRSQLRAKRTALSPEQQAQAALRLLYNLQGLRFFRAGYKFGCYLANDGEIETAPIIGRIWEQGKSCYLPILCQPHADHLRFARFTPETTLAPNRYNIPEPEVHPHELVSARRLDVILVPLVGFDDRGNRLGMGGGFYDRTLRFRLHRSHWHKPKLIGIAHDFQQADRLLISDWDVPLDLIVTDRAIITPGTSARQAL